MDHFQAAQVYHSSPGPRLKGVVPAAQVVGLHPRSRIITAQRRETKKLNIVWPRSDFEVGWQPPFHKIRLQLGLAAYKTVQGFFKAVLSSDEAPLPIQSESSLGSGCQPNVAAKTRRQCYVAYIMYTQGSSGQQTLPRGQNEADSPRSPPFSTLCRPSPSQAST